MSMHVRTKGKAVGQHEYGVGLAAKPDDIRRIALAFRAGEQKERDRIREELEKMAENELATSGLGKLVWTTPLISNLGLDKLKDL